LKFLGRAKKFLQDLSTEQDQRVQYFNVACPSGHRIRGERTEGYQALRCPVCGDGIFVLPRSPLPEPVAPPSAAPDRHPIATKAQYRDDGPIELADASHMAVDLDEQSDLPAEEVEIDWENDPGPKKAARPAAAKTATVETSRHADESALDDVAEIDGQPGGRGRGGARTLARAGRRRAIRRSGRFSRSSGTETD
jgi:DNA-directed RNA polymerase subunit RPC12/RpoP